jgi:hypothetical protein
MTKEQIAGVLERIAMLLELKGENPFKIRAYTNAARAIETFGGNLPNLQDEEAVAKIPGIGKSIALKIKELAATGSLKYLDELGAEFPTGIMELFSLSGLGAKKIKALHALGDSPPITHCRSLITSDLPDPWFPQSLFYSSRPLCPLVKKIVSAEAPKRAREGTRSRIRVIRSLLFLPLVGPFVFIRG